jgi:glutathione S-transferase
MKLYYSRGACSLAVRIIINEISLAVSYESVDLRNKTTESGEDFLQINPKGSVPVLKLDNNELLTENAVILQYLADSNMAIALLPNNTDFKRYRILEWLNYITTELHKTFANLFNPALSEEIKALYKNMIKNKCNYVDKHLSKSHFLLGEHFTLPDGYLFVIIRWLNHFKFDLNEWPNIKRYFSELNKRPSIHQSLLEEKLETS